MELEKVAEAYRETQSIRETAKTLGLSAQTVRKALLTTGDWTSPTAEKVKELMSQGHTVPEIAEELGMGINGVSSYMPYTKGTYLTKQKSKGALRVQRFRARKQASSNSADEPTSAQNEQK